MGSEYALPSAQIVYGVTYKENSNSRVIESVSSIEIVITKNKNFDPDLYKRPGQKKQGREGKEKKKTKDWTPNPNKRQKPPKHHTPGRDHRKYK